MHIFFVPNHTIYELANRSLKITDPMIEQQKYEYDHFQ